MLTNYRIGGRNNEINARVGMNEGDRDEDDLTEPVQVWQGSADFCQRVEIRQSVQLKRCLSIFLTKE